MPIPGAMDGDAFAVWVVKALAPTLSKGDIVICDNLNVHRNAAARAAIKARGAELRFLPAYSPDLNPRQSPETGFAFPSAVITRLDRVIQVIASTGTVNWIAGTSPAMTETLRYRSSNARTFLNCFERSPRTSIPSGCSSPRSRRSSAAPRPDVSTRSAPQSARRSKLSHRQNAQIIFAMQGMTQPDPRSL